MNYRELKITEYYVKKACSNIDNSSGIYFYTRVSEDNIRYCYIGKAKNLLNRCVSHARGFNQRIDISIRKRGYYSASNPYGWHLNVIHYSEDQLDKKEKEYISQYQKAGYELYNIESGGTVGKEIIGEKKPSRTYKDGLRQGKIAILRQVKTLFDKYLDYGVKKPSNKVKERKIKEFEEMLCQVKKI